MSDLEVEEEAGAPTLRVEEERDYAVGDYAVGAPHPEAYPPGVRFRSRDRERDRKSEPRRTRGPFDRDDLASALERAEREEASFARTATLVGLCAVVTIVLLWRGALHLAARGSPRPPGRPPMAEFAVAPQSEWGRRFERPPSCVSPSAETARAWAAAGGAACSPGGACLNVSRMLAELRRAAEAADGEAYSAFGDAPFGAPLPCAAAHVAGDEVAAFLDPAVEAAFQPVATWSLRLEWLGTLELCAPRALLVSSLDPATGTRESRRVEGATAVAWCLAQSALGRPECCRAPAQK